MTLGLAPTQGDLLRSTVSYCEGRVGEGSIYAVLHRECFRLFPDSMFADLFTDVGRRLVPPMIVAVVMVLQRIEGLSDREAVDRFAFDARWKYAAGGLDFDYPGFVHTVLVDTRARLAASERPDRIFEVTVAAAKAAGLVGRKRVLDSTPLYHAVATMDTVTLVRSAIRGLLKAADSALEDRLRSGLSRDDDYASVGKPVCDYDDPAAGEALVDALAKDALSLLAVLDGGELEPGVEKAAALLAGVVGQDLDEDAEGVFRIARRVAPDRVISTVDPETRHGHKTAARGFDGYKGHIAVDPDSEIITATEVTAGDTGDADAASDLLADDLPSSSTADDDAGHDADAGDEAGGVRDTEATERTGEEAAGRQESLAVYADAAYGSGELLEKLEAAGAEIMCKVQPAAAPGGRFTKDAFAIDLAAGTVTCPGQHTTRIRPAKTGAGTAVFGSVCVSCPLVAQCTSSAAGRTIKIGPHEAELARARATQADPAWRAEYPATRPKVERKLGHLMHRRHGGRRARVRGKPKVTADFSLLAAAMNLARLGVLGLASNGPGNWVAATS